MKLLTEILERNARDYAHHPAMTMRIGYRTISFTYAQTDQMARQVALWLMHEEKIKKGDRVLLLAPNSPYWVIFFFGCLYAGIVPVPLNIQMTAEQIERIATHTDARLIMAYLRLKQQTPAWLRRYNVEMLDDLISSYDATLFKPVELAENDLVEIMYTSGTTGDPKGVPLTHKNIVSNLQGITQMFDLKIAHERLLSILPLSHILEQTAGLFLVFHYAAHIIYAHSSAAIKDLLQKYKITKMVAVPEFLHILMARIEQQMATYHIRWVFTQALRLSHLLGPWSAQVIFEPVRRGFGGKLDTIASGGAALDPELEKKWNALGIVILQGYGLTETSPVLTANTYRQRRVGSVGRALANVKIHLEPDGEVWAQGPTIFSGYYKNEELTRAAFTPDGWFKTGDLATVDADGFYYLKGRKKYVIIGPGGQNVYPEDIEEELNKILGVRDSAVIGSVKDHTTEIHAVLLLDEAASAKVDDIIVQANNKLASYQQITAWTVWPEEDFPRSATRKVQKEKVKLYLHELHEGKRHEAPVKVTPLMYIFAYVSGISVEQLHPESRLLSDLRLDSLMRVELIARIEEYCGVTIDESRITQKTTIADVQQMIDKREIVTKKPVLTAWPRSWWARLIRPAGQYLLWILFKPWVRLRVVGIENLKDIKGSIIYMPNHTSYLDPLVLVMALPLRLRTRVSFAAAYDVLYQYYKRVACLAELGFNTFAFPRKEQEHIATGLINMGRILDDGYDVALFPEGQISADGKLQPLKGGAGLVAVSMDATIVPVKIDGATVIMPYEKFIPRGRGPVTVTFGTPIKFSKYENPAEVTEKIEQMMREL